MRVFVSMKAAKLSDDQVKEIHAMVQATGSVIEAAKYFGIARSIVNAISLRRTYLHLNLPILESQSKAILNKRMSLRDRLLNNHVKNPETGCWNWTLSLGKRGYGYMSINDTNTMAHRVSYEIFVGPVPDGLFVLHSCDNPQCMNPDHLHIGTHEDNMREMMERKRSCAGEKQAFAKLTNETVLQAIEMHKAGESACSLAKKFNVSSTSMLYALEGRTWSSVTGLTPRENKPKMQGTLCHAAKLCDADVVEILRLSASGMRGSKIAPLFNVSHALISGILLGKTWKHVTRPTPQQIEPPIQSCY